MSTSDLFGAAEAPSVKPAQATVSAPAPACVPASNPQVKANVACSSRFTGAPSHQCRIGGGDGAFSVDNGQTWVCRAHTPAGFFPVRKGVAA